MGLKTSRNCCRKLWGMTHAEWTNKSNTIYILTFQLRTSYIVVTNNIYVVTVQNLFVKSLKGSPLFTIAYGNHCKRVLERVPFSAILSILLTRSVPTVPQILHSKVALSVEKVTEGLCCWSNEGIWGGRISNKAPVFSEAKNQLLSKEEFPHFRK